MLRTWWGSYCSAACLEQNLHRKEVCLLRKKSNSQFREFFLNTCIEGNLPATEKKNPVSCGFVTGKSSTLLRCGPRWAGSGLPLHYRMQNKCVSGGCKSVLCWWQVKKVKPKRQHYVKAYWGCRCVHLELAGGNLDVRQPAVLCVLTDGSPDPAVCC